MGGEDRWLGGKMATGQQEAKSRRRPNGDGVSRGDKTSRNPSVQEQQNGKQCVQQTL